MTRSLSLLIVLAALGPAQPPAALELFDTTLGTSTGTSPGGALIPNHACFVRVTGNPGDRVTVGVSPTPAAAGTTWNGVSVGVNVGTMTVLWNGFTDPTAPSIGTAGILDVPFVVPDPVNLQTTLWVQAVVGTPAGGVLLTNSLALTFDGEPLIPVASGSSSGPPLAQSGGLMFINDAASFAAFWATHWIGTPMAPPTIDFTTHFALVRSLGWFGTPVNPPIITSVYLDTSGVMQIATSWGVGGPPPPIGAPPSQPWTIVAVPLYAFSPTYNETVTILLYP